MLRATDPSEWTTLTRIGTDWSYTRFTSKQAVETLLRAFHRRRLLQTRPSTKPGNERRGFPQSKPCWPTSLNVIDKWERMDRSNRKLHPPHPVKPLQQPLLLRRPVALLPFLSCVLPRQNHEWPTHGAWPIHRRVGGHDRNRCAPLLARSLLFLKSLCWDWQVLLNT